MTMSTKRKVPGKLAQPTVKSSAKLPTRNTIDESRTSVAGTEVLPNSQAETIEISSDAASDEDISDEAEDDEEWEANGDAEESKQVNGHQPGQNQSHGPDDEAAAESDGEPTSPSFGELLRGNETIDVQGGLQQSTAGEAVAPRARTTIVPPSHQSLTTVLSQALRTDDADLLESCLHITDVPTIRNTIENIDSTLAHTLLTKLAARLYRRPGRAGSLMTWVQWTLIAHGGALSSQPKVIQGLSGLQKVLSERAKGLSSLLALKGKLDLLEGQMTMRRTSQRGPRVVHNGDDEDDEEDVVWVEGETDDVSEGDLANGIASRRKRAAEEDDEDDEPTMNGVMGDSSDEEDESDGEDDESEEAEESLDEDDVDHDDVDESMGEEEDSDTEVAPPSKLQKVARSFSKRK